MITLVTHLPFWHANRGSLQRILGQVSALKDKFDINICYTGKLTPFDKQAIKRLNLDNIIESLLDYKNSACTLIPDILPKSLRSNTHNDYLSRFITYINEYKSNFYIFHNIDLHYLHCAVRNKICILDMHDIRANRANTFNNSGRTPDTEITKKEELEIFNQYDFLITIQDTDKNDLISWGIDAKKISVCGHFIHTKNQFNKKAVTSIGYLGSQNISNIDAIEWFLNNIWPAYKNEDITFNIYGHVCKKITGSLPINVIKNGILIDIDDIYKENQIMINPVQYGSGLKIKNIEALSYGIPLITTIEGARGLEDQINTSFLVANSAMEFIHCIECLLYSPTLRASLSSNGRELINQRYSYNSAYKELIVVLGS